MPDRVNPPPVDLLVRPEAMATAMGDRAIRADRGQHHDSTTSIERSRSRWFGETRSDNCPRHPEHRPGRYRRRRKGRCLRSVRTRRNPERRAARLRSSDKAGMLPVATAVEVSHALVTGVGHDRLLLANQGRRHRRRGPTTRACSVHEHRRRSLASATIRCEDHERRHDLDFFGGELELDRSTRSTSSGVGPEARRCPLR